MERRAKSPIRIGRRANASFVVVNIKPQVLAAVAPSRLSSFSRAGSPFATRPLTLREVTDVRTGNKVSSMRWDRRELAQLKQLWSEGQSAAQVAGHLECSRNAVCGRLTRLGLTRGHKPPTAKPKIRSVPKRGPTSMAARRDRVRKKRSQTALETRPQEMSKRHLYAILAEAVRNTV
ncbi:GcrA family cell cycle regulator [Bradyrhizobium canariense]|uniref:GcrA family cell cycle regulator n=1 Tax=Bradyrhizobium canariense TaxID=255045 RepID=UPI0028A11DA0|nr:GcrA family cell cycle regulator [Bradyrhizobium canariense]